MKRDNTEQNLNTYENLYKSDNYIYTCVKEARNANQGNKKNVLILASSLFKNNNNKANKDTTKDKAENIDKQSSEASEKDTDNRICSYHFIDTDKSNDNPGNSNADIANSAVSNESPQEKNTKKNIQRYYINELEPVCKHLAEVLSKHENVNIKEKAKENAEIKEKEYLTDLIILDTDKTAGKNKEYRKALEEIFDISSYIRNENSDYHISTGKEIEKIDYSSTDFLIYRLKYLCLDKDKDIKCINVNNIDTAIEQILDHLKLLSTQCDKMDIYLDMHGGLRSVQFIFNAIISLFKLNNLHLKEAFSLEFSNQRSYIYSVTKDFELYDFVSGINEFINYGRSKSLYKYCQNNKVHTDNELIKSIRKISNSIQLCRMDDFMQELKYFNTIKNNDISLLSNYYDTIKNNYNVFYLGKKKSLITIQEDKFNDFEVYACQILWCLEKDFIQQALTIVESKTENILIKTGIIKDKNEIIRNCFIKHKDLYKQYNIVSEQDLDVSLKKYKFGTNIDFDFLLKKILSDSGKEHKIFSSESKYFNSINIDDELKNNVTYYLQNGISDNSNINVLKDLEEIIYKQKNSVKIKDIDENSFLDPDLTTTTYKFSSGKIRNFKEKLNLCLNEEKILNDKVYLSYAYSLLFIYKNLKLIRNDVNHALGQCSIDTETITFWIRSMLIYLIVLKDHCSTDISQV